MTPENSRPGRRGSRRGRPSGDPVEWLLASPQPSVRYYALTELRSRPADDPEVRRARAQIAKVGWAADLLASQRPEGFWEAHAPRTLMEYFGFLRFPVFRSSVWRGMVLADLGMTASDPRIRRLAENVLRFPLALSSPMNIYHEEVCIVGNVARMLTRFGYGDHRKVRMLHDWMLADQRENGGWNCAPDAPGTLDAWEALSAFAAVPKGERSAAMDRAVARGAEFYLDRGLAREGKRYAPWSRFHYPTHYYYDVLVGLDVLTQLGYGGDRRLKPAWELLGEKRRRDGTWAIDRIHPDEVPASRPGTGWRKVTPLAIEPAGVPSQWLTLTALRVMSRAAGAS